jgi:hypothetical protein
MTEQQDARHLLERAERAAKAGDLVSADELLRDAARIQEQELGPHHPDLANTLNNLAIVAERTGSSSEAETFYRRAAAITAAALPSDHPMTVASRQNLEDFCRARGLSVDAPAVTTPTRDTEREVNAFTSEQTEADQMPVRPDSTGTTAKVANLRPPRRGTTWQARDDCVWSNSREASHLLQWVATGGIVLVAAVLLLLRPWSSRDASSTQPEPAARNPPKLYRRKLRHRSPSLPRSNSRRHRRPRLLAMIETSPRTRRPRQAASPWPPRSYAAPSRRLAATGAAIRWVTPRRRDRWCSTHASGLRAIPQWCIAGITEARCGNP